MRYVNQVLQQMSSCGQVDAVYTDFSKAFDKVNHQLLIRKLELFGVGGPILNWLESYLSGRSQQVRVGHTLSRTLMAPSGVPQGSHLGPLLFSLFINDLCDELIDSDFLLYADDLKLFRAIKSQQDACALQRDLDRVQDWCQRNSMLLNVEKCETITFSRRSQRNLLLTEYTIDGRSLKRVDVVKDLGILIDCRMTFKAQVNHVVSRGKCMLGLVKRLAKDFDCPHVARSLYCSLVRPLIEYAAVVWDPVFECDKARIESIQKQFLLFSLRCFEWTEGYHLPPYEARLSLLDLDTLRDRRVLAACSFVISCAASCDSILRDAFQLATPARSTRSSALQRLQLPPIARTCYLDNAPLNRCIKHFNAFAAVLTFNMSHSICKKILRQQFMSERQNRLRLRGYIGTSTQSATTG